MRKLLAAFASNVVFANIMIFLMFLVGLISIQMMRREMFPEMSLDLISVSVAYPGADPEEVEEGILRKIEDVLQGESGIKELQTSAGENKRFTKNKFSLNANKRKRTSQGKSGNSKPLNKHKRRNWKRYRGQG